MSKRTFQTVEEMHARQPEEPEELPRYKANVNLFYSDLMDEYFPELSGVTFVKEGEETELYWPLRKYPDRIKLLTDMHAIEPVVKPKVYTPPVKPAKPQAVKEES